MPLINCKIYLELTWANNCVMSSVAGETAFKIANTKLYVPTVTCSTDGNVKFITQLREGFEKSVNWDKY